jgi:exosortase D (VPLPA-CTERM-specific)
LVSNIPFHLAINFGILALLILSTYFAGLSYLIHLWNGEDYSYCYIIPIITLFLLWEKRQKMTETENAPSWNALPLLFTAIFLFFLGELGGEYYSIHFSLWLLIVALCWLLMGWQRLKVLGFPLVILLTAIPFPFFVYSNLTLNLKLISSKLGVWMLQAYGMSAFRDGNVIDLGFTQLQVVDACSGLRYLYPLTIMGILLAYFLKGSFLRKILLVAAALPLTVLTNSLRIAATGVLYSVWGPEVAEGFFHGFSGWLMFMVSLGVLGLLMWALRDRGERDGGERSLPQNQIESKRSEIGAEEEDKKEEQGGPLPEAGVGLVRKMLSPPQFVVAVVLLGATLAFSHAVEFREKIPIAKSFKEFPVEIGAWKGKRQVMEQQLINELDLTDYVMVSYHGTDGKSVDFYTAYYESQRKGESIHSPETCLPGSGWEFKDAGAVGLPLKDRRGKPMRVNKALMVKGDARQLAYFWFPQRDRVLTNAWELKWFNFWDALTRQRTDGALVRLITPIYPGEDVAKADERLLAFTGELLPVLNEFLPK